MTDAKKTTKEATKTTPKKTAVKTASPATSTKAAKPTAKVSASGATVTVKQTGSPARSEQWAYDTLTGLGLGRMNRTRTLQDTPAVRGMIRRVHHLVTVVSAA